jgi:hypothetical protein
METQKCRILKAVLWQIHVTSKRQQVSRRTVWTVKWDEIYFEVELEVELLVVIN